MDKFIFIKSLEVYNILGKGHRESTYQCALARELHKYKPILEYPLAIEYKQWHVNTYYVDIVINSNLPIECKWVKKLKDGRQFCQIRNYMTHLHSDIGYLINFGDDDLEVIKFTGKNEVKYLHISDK